MPFQLLVRVIQFLSAQNSCTRSASKFMVWQGEMLKSPVRGQPPYVPDIGKMPKRDICKKEDKRKGKNGRFGG